MPPPPPPPASDQSQPTECASCGADLRTIEFKVDKKGRGICKPCVAKLKAKRKAKADAEAAAAGGAAAEMASGDVMDILLADSSATKQEPCPECQSFIDPGSVMCIHCGYNLESGKQLRTRVIAATKEKKSKKNKKDK